MKNIRSYFFLLGVLIFFAGFFAGQNVKTNDLQAELIKKQTKAGRKLNISLTETSEDNDKLRSLSRLQDTGETRKNDDLGSLQHELEDLTENLSLQEEEFYRNQLAEIQLYENMLDSMVENKFSDEDIEEIRKQIVAIESAKFEDTINQDQDSGDFTIDNAREDLTQSLRQNTDMSDEDLDNMVNSLFPLQDNETIGNESPDMM